MRQVRRQRWNDKDKALSSLHWTPNSVDGADDYDDDDDDDDYDDNDDDDD